MKILVTGGSGFIGSHVVDVLIARGYEPVIFDRVASPYHASAAVPSELGEITDAAALERAMRGCDAVIHLAAMADVGDVQADPTGAERANGRGTLAVLEAARQAGVGRVVYGSTIWVYSDCEETAVDEDTRLVPPGHLYTATKLAGELYCRSYSELYGLEYTVLRFGIPYGPRARPAAVVPVFVEKALRGEPLTIAGDGSQSRRFVYVEDLADGIVRGLAPRAANRVYNLAGSETVTILEIAEAVRDLVGTTEIVHTEARAGDFGGKEVSSDRAGLELGWEPATPFREGVRRYVEWRRVAVAPAATGKPPAASRKPRRKARAALASGAWRALRARRVGPALSALAVSGAFFWSFATDDALPLLANPQTSVKTSERKVGLLVKAPPQIAAAVAAELRDRGAAGSFALSGPTSAPTLEAIRASGSDAMPQLRPGGLIRWLDTPGQLKRTAHILGVSGHLYYVPPTTGLTFGQDLLGHTAGATPVAGAVRLDGRTERGSLRRGAVVELSIANVSASWQPLVGRLLEQLREHRLRAVPADSLLRDAGRRG